MVLAVLKNRIESVCAVPLRWARSIDIPYGSESDEGALIRGILLLASMKRLSVIGAGVGLALGLLYLLIATPLYTATMVVGPAETTTGLGMQDSGWRQSLSFLTGNVGASVVVDPYTLFNQLTTSGLTAQRLQSRDHILQTLNPKIWDTRNDRWRRPSGVKQIMIGAVHQLFGRPAWIPPNASNVQNLIKNQVVVRNVENTSFRIYEYKNADPWKAELILQLLYRETDELARELAVKRAEILSQYLQNRLATMTEPTYRAALYDALAQQEIIRVMGQSNAPFAAQIIDPPRASPAPTDPPIFKTLLIATIVGAILGGALAYLAAFWIRLQRARAEEIAQNGI